MLLGMLILKIIQEMICPCCSKLMQITTVSYNSKCSNCGVVLSKNTPRRMCSKVSTSKPEVSYYNLCINCNLCPKKHNMKRVYNLKPQARPIDGLYINNLYSCDICNVPRVNEGNLGVLHCLSCRYDVCGLCEKGVMGDWM